MKLPATIDERRALRGLVRHARRCDKGRAGRLGKRWWARPGAQHRELVGIQLGGRRSATERRRCVWCGDETEPRRRWHDGCVVAYLVASGKVRYAVNGETFVSGPCEVCGRPGTEIDHRDSLAAAARSGSWRRRIRAFTRGNLRPLCRECHVAKTRRDRREQADLASPQMVLSGVQMVIPGVEVGA